MRWMTGDRTMPLLMPSVGAHYEEKDVDEVGAWSERGLQIPGGEYVNGRRGQTAQMGSAGRRRRPMRWMALT